MLERMIALFERLVQAQEIIARAMSGQDDLVEKNLPPNSAPPPVTEYDAFSREKLLQLCTERGIENLPRARGYTLIKKLVEWDLKHAPEVEKESLGGKPADPFADSLPEKNSGAADPLDSLNTSAEELPGLGKRTYTEEEVRGSLQDLLDRKGRDAVLKILREEGSVDRLGDLEEEKYRDVINAAALLEEGGTGWKT